MNVSRQGGVVHEKKQFLAAMYAPEEIAMVAPELKETYRYRQARAPLATPDSQGIVTKIVLIV